MYFQYNYYMDNQHKKDNLTDLMEYQTKPDDKPADSEQQSNLSENQVVGNNGEIINLNYTN